MNRSKIGFACIALAVVFATGLQASAGTSWLTHVNNHRALANLPPVTETPAWSSGDWLHARYCVKNNFIGHNETAGNQWYTPEGATAAGNSNVMVSSSTGTSDQGAIDLWMQGPFHAVGIIDPHLTSVGYGSYREGDGGYQMAAALDVWSGHSWSGVPPTVTFPVKWPSDGKTVTLTSYGGSEYPDPLSGCPGYTAPTGLPIILQLGTGSVTPSVTAHSLYRGGTPLEHCIFDETNYTNAADSSGQSLGRAVLGARDAIVLIPRSPLTPGSTYAVSITTNGQTHSWSFSVGSAPPDTSWTAVPGTTPSSPSLAWNNSSGKVRMVVQREDGGLATASFNSDGSFNNDWTNIAGIVTSSPALAHNPGDGTSLMVVRGGNDTIWTATFSAGGIFNNDWKQVPGAILSAPALAWNPTTSRFHMAVRGGSDTIWTATLNADGTFNNDWRQVPGAILATPAIAYSPSTGKIHMVVRGGNDTIWTATFNSGGLFNSDWTNIPGAVLSSPALAWSAASNTLRLVVRGGNDAIYAASFNSSGVFNYDWSRIPGATASAPVIASGPYANFVQILVRSSDNGLWGMAY